MHSTAIHFGHPTPINIVIPVSKYEKKEEHKYKSVDCTIDTSYLDGK